MKLLKSQDVARLTLKQKMRKLGQPVETYNCLMNTDEENIRYVENLVNTILTKGYLPA